jgi:hypothetical protein
LAPVDSRWDNRSSDTSCDEQISESHLERPSFSNTSSQKTLDQIVRWMSTCDASHPDCRTTPQRRFVPTRLLDLNDSISPDYIQMVEAGKLTVDDTAYMTLSHCWGAGPGLRLTQESFDSCKRGILVADLPQTFQDAAGLVRNLVAAIFG